MKRWWILLLGCAGLFCTQAVGAELRPIAEAEDEVYRAQDANNGAGPFWCFGSTCIARLGSDVFVSGLETLKDAKPLNNTRWMLFKRQASGWALQQKDETGRTREPCPIGAFPDGSVLLSVNPTLTPPEREAGPAQPQILRFSARDLRQPYRTMLPTWNGQPPFTEHSYRSFAVDGDRREMILFQNVGYTHAEWSFCNSDGQWIHQGKLTWPWGADYAKPQPIRVCYPSVQLRNRAVYFCGVSDIVEPNPTWRDYKRKLTGREWDYDFRRLFFTWTPDITTGKFAPWIEIASREKTAGYIFPCDLWVDADGRAHILWFERALDTRLRKDFFPNERQSEALNYAIIDQGKVIHQQPVLIANEGIRGEMPGRGRFHGTPDGRLFIFHHVSGTNATGQAINENRLTEILPDRTFGKPLRVPLKTPMSTFFTASVRAGSAPSNILDVLGEAGGAIRYARIRLAE